MTLAPIVLFVYNRPWHTQQTIEALKKNNLADKSDLFIYADAPKNDASIEKVIEVRKYINTIIGFQNTTIIERSKNWGLADNIISGVTDIISKYGKIIVLEDDIVTSQYFLIFMNNALEFYRNESSIWHISGWNYPIKCNGNYDIFAWRGMECWGWGTWQNRWNFYTKNPAQLIHKFTKKDIDFLNLDGYRNVWRQVQLNYNGKINTWAVFWYTTIYTNNGLSINPVKTFVKNIGMDGSGDNCSNNDIYSNDLNQNKNIKFSKFYTENKNCIIQIKEFSIATKISFWKKIIKKLMFWS